MATIDAEWMKKQLCKAISAEQSVLKTERDHRDHLKSQKLVGMYDKIVADDEKHVESLKKIGDKYGCEISGIAESAGGILGGLKSVVEGATATDPFQTIGNDLMMKSNALNYDLAWTSIFKRLGDEEAATVMNRAARDDERHEKRMRESLASVGVLEARGKEVERK